jgi:hypothetical protein
LEGLKERPLGRIGIKWDGMIKLGRKEILCESVSWTHLVQDGVYWWDVVNTVLKMGGIYSPAEEF